MKTVGAGGAVVMLPGCALGKSNAGVAGKGRRPNIIVIISDDLGYADLGCYGCKDIPTPNIDSIAKKGVRFTNGYVSCPVCSPTRAGLATGRYQQRFGHEFNPGGSRQWAGLPLKEVTIATVLKSSGYATGAVGKWHLGMAAQFHPFKRGYDEFFGFLGGAHSYVASGLKSTNPILRGTEPVDEKEYLTDAFSREAVSFVERHCREPFFLYLAYNAVHLPMQAPKRYRSGFEHITDSRRRTYAGMLTAMDDGIGALLANLRELGLEKETLLFFINDNGGAPKNSSRNNPLRGCKSAMWEGGIRVPFMVQWPVRLQGGVTYDYPVISLDVLPTAAAAAGAKLPSERKIDGVNLLPYLTGRNGEWPHEALFWRMGQRYAVRSRYWKLVHQKGKSELFNLASDISESRNAANEHAEVLKEMEELFAQWNCQMHKPLWQPKKREKKKVKTRKISLSGS